ncbi:MAG: molybdopterin-synthase adenylyltransferase MoeB [Nitrososphaerota archaeon]|nr:molybdopterin-synthase adenylyltransferase MoeB [Nitrososphaerota archaeon]
MPATRETPLSRAEIERYSRQLVLPEVGPEGQRRLKASSALVVGAGGLGIPASVYLTAAGVGRIGIVDHDTIARSNLHRQTIYTEADIGKRKVEVAAKRLRETNPLVTVEAYDMMLDSSNATKVISGYDVVLDCTDNFPARYLVNDACVISGKPDVYASVFRFDGQAAVFDSRKGPCYRCLFPTPPPPESVQDCAVAGVLGVLPGIMGSIQAVQAVNILLAKGEPLVGRLVLFNATDMTFSELRFRKNPECPVCGEHPTVTKLIDYERFCGLRKPVSGSEVTPAQLKKMMDDGEKVVLLDVREPFEHEFGSLRGSRLIPLGELQNRVGELDKDAPIVAYCLVGNRSAVAVDILASKGFRARNLVGGLRAWADAVDPSVPVF